MTRTDLILVAVEALYASDDHAYTSSVDDAIIDAAVEADYDLDDGEIELIVEAAQDRIAAKLADNAARMG